MGCASRVTPERLHNASPESSLPIENSPPGIQAMPSGVGVGAAVLLAMVGAKAEAAAASSLFWLAGVESEPGDERNLPTANTPATTTTAATIHHIALDREAVGRFCD